MTTTNTTTATISAACPKCSGTGIVAVFAHVKNGVCFDCDGHGTIAATIVKAIPNLDAGAGTDAEYAAARTIADAFMADPTTVSDELAVRAFHIFEATRRARWTTADHDRRNALAGVINYLAAKEREAKMAARAARKAHRS